MKTYQISEELLNEVIVMLIDYKQDADDIDNDGGCPRCWSADIAILIDELEDLKNENI